MVVKMMAVIIHRLLAGGHHTFVIFELSALLSKSSNEWQQLKHHVQTDRGNSGIFEAFLYDLTLLAELGVTLYEWCVL